MPSNKDRLNQAVPLTLSHNAKARDHSIKFKGNKFEITKECFHTVNN